MDYSSQDGIVLNRAARRRKTVLSIKNKGGVGGSHNAIALATVLRMSGADTFSTVLIDCDGSTGTSISRMGERDADGTVKVEQSFEAGVPAIDLFDPASRGTLFELTETDDRFLIFDAPAASLNMFRNLSENLGALDWAEHNEACDRDLVIMVPITPHLNSIVGVAQAIETFGAKATYVVVRSMRGCVPGDYVLWDAPNFHDRYGRVVSGRSKQRLAEAGGAVIDMPALNAGVLARAEALNVTFADALASPHLRPHERISIRRWLEAWTTQLDKVRDSLGLDDAFQWRVA